ncbi:RNA polymerase sigma factor SigJ [Paenibacillus allorhizosphaerae]|uniref:ECF RNA polymerase sigma factor SigJ n=1 Tax=Paenibacillus allorhizosphaerae TaxID=2849866 RepID=A0ABM8VUJ7_9BACL|nr:RNA polymerase sigma factor SigJ [Paenibacillus allorhizosphaerae]CAG7658995.1 ECF RNA polymerase sigma factor SigJ [Paenibacillus allorhizosphaerae]
MTTNESDYGALYNSYRPLLFSLAYRMLGSVMDAEDIVHEAFLAVGKSGTEHVSNIQSYLCKIVTNRCINYTQSSGKRREVYVGTWLPEPLIGDAGNIADPLQSYIHKESISTAYLLLLQQLTYVERAVFLLREALQYDYDEIADIVGKTSTNCRQIYHRAKRSVGNYTDANDAVSHTQEDQIAPSPSSEQMFHLVELFMNALANADTAQLMNVLSIDATLFADGGGKVTAPLRPLHGSERISIFLVGLRAKVSFDVSYHLTEVNGGPGIILKTNTQTVAVFSFKIEKLRIVELYTVGNPDKLAHIG